MHPVEEGGADEAVGGGKEAVVEMDKGAGCAVCLLLLAGWVRYILGE